MLHKSLVKEERQEEKRERVESKVGRDEERKKGMTFETKEENKSVKKSRKGAGIFKSHLHSYILYIKIPTYMIK